MTALLLLALIAQDPRDLAKFDPQQWFKCPTCGVHGYVDLPQQGATLPKGAFIAGWGLECGSGRTVDRVDLWYEVEDGRWVPLKQDASALHVAVYRPDVFAAYAPYCANVRMETGWYLEVSNPPPTGARRVIIQLWSGPYHAELVRTWTVQ